MDGDQSVSLLAFNSQERLGATTTSVSVLLPKLTEGGSRAAPRLVTQKVPARHPALMIEDFESRPATTTAPKGAGEATRRECTATVKAIFTLTQSTMDAVYGQIPLRTLHPMNASSLSAAPAVHRLAMRLCVCMCVHVCVKEGRLRGRLCSHRLAGSFPAHAWHNRRTNRAASTRDAPGDPRQCHAIRHTSSSQCRVRRRDTARW